MRYKTVIGVALLASTILGHAHAQNAIVSAAGATVHVGLSAGTTAGSSLGTESSSNRTVDSTAAPIWGQYSLSTVCAAPNTIDPGTMTCGAPITIPTPGSGSGVGTGVDINTLMLNINQSASAYAQLALQWQQDFFNYLQAEGQYYIDTSAANTHIEFGLGLQADALKERQLAATVQSSNPSLASTLLQWASTDSIPLNPNLNPTNLLTEGQNEQQAAAQDKVNWAAAQAKVLQDQAAIDAAMQQEANYAGQTGIGSLISAVQSRQANFISNLSALAKQMQTQQDAYTQANMNVYQAVAASDGLTVACRATGVCSEYYTKQAQMYQNITNTINALESINETSLMVSSEQQAVNIGAQVEIALIQLTSNYQVLIANYNNASGAFQQSLAVYNNDISNNAPHATLVQDYNNAISALNTFNSNAANLGLAQVSTSQIPQPPAQSSSSQ